MIDATTRAVFARCFVALSEVKYDLKAWQRNLDRVAEIVEQADDLIQTIRKA